LADQAIAPGRDFVAVRKAAPARVRSVTNKQYRKLAFWIAITDALSLVLALWLTALARSSLRVGPAFTKLLVAAPIVWLIIFAAFQLYSIPRLSPAEEFRRILEATGVGVGVTLAAALVLSNTALNILTQGWIILTWALALVFVLAGREIWHKRMGRMRARGELSYRTLVLGANEEAIKIAESLQPPTSGYTPIGLVRTDFGWVSWDGAPILGSVDQISELIETHGIECVFIASSAMGPDLMKRVTKYLRWQDVEVRVSANLTDILASRLTVQPVGYLLTLSLRPVRLNTAQVVAKRFFDLLVGSLLVLLTTPIWLVTSTLIKTTSRGPILFRQERIGRAGRPFTIYKFRTMIRGAELLMPELMDKNEFEGGVLFKMRNDPRVTRVGGWLRRWSLDELPQLLNVLKGDMSLVGPRPPLPNEVAVYQDWHRDRLEVQPGITGLWQVGGRSELSFDDYVRLDLFYIENWSVIYDLFILGKTIPAVLFKKGAF
jgi:exopolysaccharide biosynthesis polyprenyl glycosylphosphotransferase